jgi:hypothetical protein
MTLDSGLTIDQVSKVNTLCGVIGLDFELEQQIKQNYPHLLENSPY